MQLPLWPSFELYCFVSSLFPVDEDVNEQTRSQLVYGFDKLRMINSYLTSVIPSMQREKENSRQHSNSTIRYSPHQINR
jgi:hypothetical protein